ncbi:MAG: VanZ family protein [Oscillospiraceae bacterium]|nr:VanZ family protein [Oscillospiraceae bacterium]
MRTTTIIPLGVIAMLAATVLAFLPRKKRRGNCATAVSLFSARFFGLWYVLTAVFVLFKLETIGLEPRGLTNPFEGNYVPLKTIMHYITEKNLVQLAGNAAMLFPLPILLHLNFPRLKYKRCLFFALCVSVLIEPLQFLVNIMINAHANIIDIDDFLLNTVGCLLGLLALRLMPAFRKGER